MSQIRLVIADYDAMFLEKFSTYLLKNKAAGLSLELFTEKDKLAEWFKNGKNVDLVVISSTLFNDLDEKPENRNIFLLRDCAESIVPQGYNGINKFSPADQIMKEILSSCAEYIPRDLNSGTKTGQINLVLYADGTDALNPLAQGLAHNKASKGKRTFFINLDEFSNTDLYLGSNNTKGLSEMLYYVKSKKDNLSLYAEVCTSCDAETGIYFMKGHNNPEDVTNLKKEDLSALLVSIHRNLPYDEIVISRGFFTDPLALALLDEADKIYVSALNYPTSLNRLIKITGLIRGYEEKKGQNLKDKTTFWVSSINNGQSAPNLEIQDFDFFYLPYSDYWTSGPFLLSNEYLAALEAALNKQEG
ncbi:MAG: hypothetical protein ACOYIF_07480 [Acetivibrionales bacterium]|jgi:hypothetical protein